MQMEAGMYVTIQEGDGSQHTFRVRNTTPLLKVIKAYMSKKALPWGTVRFTYEGELIMYWRGTTAADHGMVSGDVIDAIPEQCGD